MFVICYVVEGKLLYLVMGRWLISFAAIGYIHLSMEAFVLCYVVGVNSVYGLPKMVVWWVGR